MMIKMITMTKTLLRGLLLERGVFRTPIFVAPSLVIYLIPILGYHNIMKMAKEF